MAEAAAKARQDLPCIGQAREVDMAENFRDPSLQGAVQMTWGSVELSEEAEMNY